MEQPDAASTSIGLGTFVVSCACATLGMMISLSFLVFHIYHRRNKIVKMSSPYMNMITSFGAILLCVVCFLYGVDYLAHTRPGVQSTLCQVRHWLTVHSITLVFGPVATKAWRVHSIFEYGFAKKVVIKDPKLVVILVGLLLVDSILMTLWQTIDPVTVKHNFFSEMPVEYATETSLANTSIETTLVQECSCGKYAIWLAVLSIWKVTIIVACLYFSWKTKSVPLQCLNDAAVTFTAVFLSILVTFCAVMVTTSLRGQQDAVYIITTIAIAACAILIQIVLFLPKVQYWWRTPNNTSPRISSASLKEVASAEIPPFRVGDLNGNTFNDEGLVEIVEENKALKDSLLEKEDLITNLQSHLDLAKDKLSKLPTHLDLKHDSGMEADTSSGSHDVIYDVLKSPDLKRDRSGLYRVEWTPRSEADGGAENTNLNYVESYSIPSMNSAPSFVDEFTDIRNSIAADLENASLANSGLRSSLAMDKERPYSETEWLCETTTEPELAGSIAQSYNLADHPEMFSYITSHIPRENCVMQVRRSRRFSSASAHSENVSNKSVDGDNSPFEVPPATRDSATPNSQQHAAILRYYTYRHDGFQRFKTFRVNRDFRPPSFRFRPNVPSRRSGHDMQILHQDKTSPTAIFNVPNVVQKPPRVYINDPKDSFV